MPNSPVSLNPAGPPTNRHTEQVAMLRQLKLSAFLHELARLECEQRAQRSTHRRLHQSYLPREQTFATFELGQLPPPFRLQIERLRTGEFVEQAVNVIAVWYKFV